MKPDPPKFSVRPPAAEFGASALRFAANFGTWSVNEADKTITRRAEGALNPNTEGTEAKLSVSLAGDELKLVGTSAAGVRTDSVYRRAR